MIRTWLCDNPVGKACGDRLEEAGAGYEPNVVPVASGSVPHDESFIASRFLGCQAQNLTLPIPFRQAN
ncbi:MAG: hypothetical protein DMG83_00270 [Acidobacteria bacterium]|nr:MAG: hypothetical protein DMG83_00270 [Acidobacteriota bacterium]